MRQAQRRIERLARLPVLHELDTDHQALLADVADVGKRAEFIEHLRELLRRAADVREELVLLEQLQRRDGRGARERIPRVRVAVKESLEVAWESEKRVEDLLRGERGGQ